MFLASRRLLTLISVMVANGKTQYPACIIPFGKAKKTEQEFTKKPGQGGPKCKLLPDHMALDQDHTLIWNGLDNPEVVEGAPCSIQIFTSRMRDEECLAAAEIIDTCLKDAQDDDDTTMYRSKY